MKAIILTGLLMLPFVSVTSALASTPVYNSKTNSSALSPASVGGCTSCAERIGVQQMLRLTWWRRRGLTGYFRWDWSATFDQKPKRF